MFHAHQSHKRRIAWEHTARSCANLDFSQGNHEMRGAVMDIGRQSRCSRCWKGEVWTTSAGCARSGPVGNFAITRWHRSLQCLLSQKRETSLSLYLAVIRSTERPAIFGSDPPMRLRDASEPRHTRQSSSNLDAFSPHCDRPRAKYRDVMFETCGVSSLVEISSIMGFISRHRIWQSHHSLFPGA